MHSGPGHIHHNAAATASPSLHDQSLGPGEGPPPIYTLHELHTITTALKLGAKLYDPSSRQTLSTSNNVTMPFLEYGVYGAFQVASVGAPPKYLVECLLHDTFNGYAKGAQTDLAHTIDRKFGRYRSPDHKISNLINRVSTPDRAEHDESLA